nr:CoA-binding protein [Ardenticatenia bacterium]
MLDTLFSPRSIAVIGASRTEGKLGHAVLANLVEGGFQGSLYPINPKPGDILDLPSHASLDEIEGEIDLAVIVIPSKGVLDALEVCGQRGVGSVIVISAGFRETGHEGLMAERKMAEIADQYQMRIVGPNCLGVIDTLASMNASFAVGMPRQGKIAFMSQSGALCTSILDIALARDVGFSRFVSLGNKADLDEIDFLEAWSDDPESNVIMGYVEGIADGARFIDVARRLTKRKPVLIIKSGTPRAGSPAVSSHTGTAAGTARPTDSTFQ